jgi:hypothetical protein
MPGENGAAVAQARVFKCNSAAQKSTLFSSFLMVEERRIMV